MSQSTSARTQQATTISTHKGAPAISRTEHGEHAPRE